MQTNPCIQTRYYSFVVKVAWLAEALKLIAVIPRIRSNIFAGFRSSLLSLPSIHTQILWHDSAFGTFESDLFPPGLLVMKLDWGERWGKGVHQQQQVQVSLRISLQQLFLTDLSFLFFSAVQKSWLGLHLHSAYAKPTSHSDILRVFLWYCIEWQIFSLLFSVKCIFSWSTHVLW